MTGFGHDRHRDRLMAAVAVLDEMLDPDDDLAQIRDEYTDARLCGDEALRKRVDAEAAARERTVGEYGKTPARVRGLGGSWARVGQEWGKSWVLQCC